MKRVATVFLLWLCTAVNATAGDLSELSGVWLLDDAKSDDVGAAIKRLLPRKERQGERRSTIQIGEDPDANRLKLSQLVLSESDLQISQSDPEITFTYAGDYRRTFFTDGRGQSISAMGGPEQRNIGFSFGTWIDGSLLVESRKENGIIIYERYRLLEDTSELEQRIEVSFPAAGESVDLRRVFNRAEAK